MADVRLDRTDYQRPVGGTPGGHHRAQGLDLDGVAKTRSRAVGLDVIDVGRGQIGVGQRGADHRLLGGAVGGRKPVAAPVVIHGRAADQREDMIAVGRGVAESFEHEHAAAFTAHVAVGRGVERLASPVVGHHVGLGKRQGQLGSEDQVDATGQRHIGFAPSQTLTSQVDGDQ